MVCRFDKEQSRPDFKTKADCKLMSKSNINLTSNVPTIWSSFGCSNVKGYAFDNNGSYLEGEDFAEFFRRRNIQSLDQFKEAVTELNGLYSVVLNAGKVIYLACDVTRTYPLFYYRDSEGWAVYDSAHKLKQEYGLEVSGRRCEEFLYSGYLTEDKTLIEEMKQVPAQEVVALGEAVTATQYFNFATKAVDRSSLDEMQERLVQCYSHVRKRLVDSLNERTAVLPLSGGYDSRLVLAMLKEEGYKKIICFSYGARSSYEVNTAEKVAKSMGEKFIRIRYSDNFVTQSIDMDEFIDYEIFAGNFSSLPHVQDFLAVKHLKKEGLVPADSVFIPGIAGDIFSGTQIPDGACYSMSRDEIISLIKAKYFNFSSALFPSEINICEDCYGYSVIENFCVKEKVPKFVANSVRVYEYWGFGFLMPLMDKELLRFFSRVPLEMKNRNFRKTYRIDSNLYDSTNFLLFEKYKAGIRKSDIRTALIRRANYLKRLLGFRVDSLNNSDAFLRSLERSLCFTTSLKNEKNTNLAFSEVYLQLIKDFG